MKLNTLKPRLAILNTNRVKVLDVKAGATQRVSGSSWMKVRRAVMERDLYTCARCKVVSMHHEVDHKTPLEQGGDAMGMHNLQLLCNGCHAAKSATEASARAAPYRTS